MPTMTLTGWFNGYSHDSFLLQFHGSRVRMFYTCIILPFVFYFKYMFLGILRYRKSIEGKKGNLIDLKMDFWTRLFGFTSSFQLTEYRERVYWQWGRSKPSLITRAYFSVRLRRGVGKQSRVSVLGVGIWIPWIRWSSTLGESSLKMVGRTFGLRIGYIQLINYY